LFLYSISVTAQDSILKTDKYAIDTNYIKKYSDKLTIYISTYKKANTISIIETVNDRSLIYNPNESVSFGPGFSYKWLGLDLSFITLGKNDNKYYGKTTKFDIQSHFYLRRFLADLNLQYYRGFYVDKSDVDSFDNSHITNKLIRPDIFQLGIGGSFMYLTNYKKSSMKATFSQSEIQKKSAGSWALGMFFHVFALGTDTSLNPFTPKEACLVPPQLRSNYDSSAYINGSISTNFGIMGGYLHTFVLKKWFVTLSILPGLARNGYTYALVGDTAVKKEHSRLSGRVQTRFGIGYNSQSYYFGLSVINDNFDFNNSTKSYIKQQYGVVRFYVGYRFIPKNERI
jgi:hypothetical protein